MRQTKKVPSKRAAEIQRFLRSQRYKAKREQLDERYPFQPTLSDEVEDPSQDAKRIRRTLELDDINFKLSGDLHLGVRMMMLCAGNMPSLEAPLDTQFLYAYQRISDYHTGRMITSDEEWSRIGAIEHAWSCVRRTLDEIDAERKHEREARQLQAKKAKDFQKKGSKETKSRRKACGLLPGPEATSSHTRGGRL